MKTYVLFLEPTDFRSKGDARNCRESLDNMDIISKT